MCEACKFHEILKMKGQGFPQRQPVNLDETLRNGNFNVLVKPLERDTSAAETRMSHC